MQQADVDEAMRLIAMSKASLFTTDDEEGRCVPPCAPAAGFRVAHGDPDTGHGCWRGGFRGCRTKDPTSVVYDIVLELAQADGNEASYEEALARTVRKGYKQSDLDDALKEYQDLNVWVVSRDKTKIRLISDLALDD